MAFNDSGAGAAAARVRFTEFAAADDPMLVAWARFRGLLAGPAREPSRTHTAAPPVHPESVLWRLLATNNRELGRSYVLYRRYSTARAHVEQLQADSDALSIELIHGPHNGSRGWVIVADDVPVVTCSRWYSSISAGALAAAGALHAFRTAVVWETPDRSDSSGRYRRRPPAVPYAST
ncbi:hypothetical protein ACFUTX_14015 [Microbacterium sp. NPDC057407]|uniref:hypothetical protein n=1 Tax=Microbacterium sp. NPDC057407 TaxID=3346120 RepID=UPI00366C0A9C